MVMARLIEKEIHGIFVVMHLLVLILSMVSKTGVHLALVRRKHNTSQNISFAFWIGIIFGSAFTFLFFLSAPLIQEYYSNDISVLSLRVMSLFFVIFSLGLVSEALLIRDLDFKSLFITKCGSYFIGNIVLGIVLAYYGYGIWSFILGFLLFTFLNSIGKYLARPHSLKWSFGIKEVQEVKHFAFGFTITELLNTTATYIDKIIIGKLVNLDMLAVFQKGQHTSRLPVSVFGSAFDNVLYALFSNVGIKRIDQKEIFLRLTSMTWIVAVSILVFTYCYSDQIVIVLLGRTWASSVVFFKLFTLIMPLILIAKLSDAYFRAENKMYISAKVKLLYLVLVIFSSLSALFLDLYNVCLLLACSYLLYIIVMILTTLRHVKLDFLVYLKELSPAFFIGISLYTLNTILQFYLSIRIGYVLLISMALLFHLLALLLVLYYRPNIFGEKNLRFLVSAAQSNKVLSFLLPEKLRSHLKHHYERL